MINLQFCCLMLAVKLKEAKENRLEWKLKENRS
jgi:hypothetical protein